MEEPKNQYEIKMKRLEGRVKRNTFKNRCFQGKRLASDQFESDNVISKMREPYTEEFYEIFAKGMQYYEDGLWQEAKEVFEQVEQVKGMQDLPMQAVYDVMESENFEAP